MTVDCTADGGYIIATRYVDSITGDYFILLLKLDQNGNVQWSNIYSANNISTAFSKSLAPKVKQTSDHGYVVSSYLMEVATSIYYPNLILFDSTGNFVSAKYYTLTSSIGFWGSKPRLTSDGGYIAAFNAADSAFSTAFGHVVKTDAALATGCFETAFSLNRQGISFAVDSGFTTTAIVNETIHELGNTGISLNYSDNCDINVGLNEYLPADHVSISSNPSGGTFLITGKENIASIHVYNLTGQEVLSCAVDDIQATIDLSGRSKGIYLVRIASSAGSFTVKVIIE